MFVYPLPSILTHFQPILIENLSTPIRIKSKSIYFPCLGSLAGVIKSIKHGKDISDSVSRPDSEIVMVEGRFRTTLSNKIGHGTTLRR